MDCFLLQLGPIGRFAGVDQQKLLKIKKNQRIFLVDDNSDTVLCDDSRGKTGFKLAVLQLTGSHADVIRTVDGGGHARSGVALLHFNGNVRVQRVTEEEPPTTTLPETPDAA